MPRNFRRFFASIFLVLFSFLIISAQTTADGMRERITKSKSYIAVKNYTAAIYELEAIKRETNDQTVHSVVNVLLMNSYLEQGDYKRAQDLLNELAKSTKPNAAANYVAVAGQVIKGARTQIERYKSLGLSVSDRNLPLEAATDLEKMRQTLELVVEQSKVLGKDKAQTSNAMALLEEATNARSNLAKDDYDASRWKNEAADAREILANSRSVVINADGTTSTPVLTTQNTVASNNNPVANTTNTANTTNNQTQTRTIPINNNPIVNTQTNNSVAAKETTNSTERNTTNTQTNNNPQTNTTTSTMQTRDRKVETNNQQTNNTTAQTNTSNNEITLPLDVGSLVEYAIQQVTPTYPQQARTIRQTGMVRVELLVDEEGKVLEVKKASGPSLLQSAARDAAKKWRFRPFMRDGQPIKAMGFINFNFSL